MKQSVNSQLLVLYLLLGTVRTLQLAALLHVQYCRFVDVVVNR
jgi:hypothetical protein